MAVDASLKAPEHILRTPTPSRPVAFQSPERTGFQKFLIFGFSTIGVIAAIALWLIGVAVTLWLLFLLYWQITGVHGVKVEAPSPTMVNMLPPPPPPPPPPPKPVEKPPEPTDKPNPVPNPEPAPSKAAPAPMTIAGPAQAGSDSFGLAAGNGQGNGAPSSGGTCLGANCGVASGGISDGFYRRYLSGALQERVQDNSKVNRLVFTADFAITISGGRVTRVDLLRSSGKDDRDALLKAILENVGGLDAPPASVKFPQKITVRGRRAL